MAKSQLVHDLKQCREDDVHFPKEFDDIMVRHKFDSDDLQGISEVSIEFQGKQLNSYPFGSYSQASEFAFGLMAGLIHGYKILGLISEDHTDNNGNSSSSKSNK